MDKLSEHAIRMLEITDKPYRNEYGMINKDLQDKHDIAKAVYSIILQVQMLKMANRNSSEKPNNSQTCANCKFDHEEWFEEACDSCCDAHSNWQPKTEPQTDPCDGCVCDDGKHLMYCMNCKGIAWKTEPPKVEDEPQTESSTNEEKVQLTDCAWGKGDK